MDERLPNFNEWYKRNILKIYPLTEEPCCGCYKIDGKETYLSFRAIPIDVYSPFLNKFGKYI